YDEVRKTVETWDQPVPPLPKALDDDYVAYYVTENLAEGQSPLRRIRRKSPSQRKGQLTIDENGRLQFSDGKNATPEADYEADYVRKGISEHDQARMRELLDKKFKELTDDEFAELQALRKNHDIQDLNIGDDGNPLAKLETLAPGDQVRLEALRAKVGRSDVLTADELADLNRLEAMPETRTYDLLKQR